MAKLIIKNFGPITEAEIDVKELNILIGPQASGKSTIAKTLYFFLTVKQEVYKYFSNAYRAESINPTGLIPYLAIHLVQRFNSFSGYTRNQDKLHCEYHFSNNKTITITNNTKSINLDFSDELKKGLIECTNVTKGYIDTKQKNKKDLMTTEMVDDDFQSVLGNKLEQLFPNSILSMYFPAGRSIINAFSDGIRAYLLSEQQEKIENNGKMVQGSFIDSPTREFLNRISLLKDNYSNGFLDNINEPTLSELQNELRNILKGDYYRIDGTDYLKLHDGQIIRLNMASSGQQEILWIVMLLFHQLVNNRPSFSIIEEPEAQLYPDAQRELAKLFAHYSAANHQLLLTTHSPYVLSALNNHIYAYNVAKAQPNRATEIEQLIPKSQWLSPDDVSVYEVINGKTEKIQDLETGEIMSERIDSASQKINQLFDNLVEIEFKS